MKHTYKLKHNKDIGYWVDGFCGYMFVGYFDTKEKCLEEYRKKLRKAGV